MKYLYLFVAVLLVASCAEPTDVDTTENQTPSDEETMTTEQLIVRHIESNLSIPATEKYSYKIYKEDMNGDDSLDYIITVNRLQRALDEAAEKGQTAKRAELGFMGNFNYIFYMDGKKKTLTVPIPVPSSPHAELRVTFDHIRSEAYKDIMVDFRIRNSCFRRFFTIINTLPRQTFEAKLFDGLGTPETEAYVVKYEQGSYSLAKDILIYKGELESIEISDPLEVYTLDPLIEETEVLDRRWFFNDHELKYFTEK